MIRRSTNLSLLFILLLALALRLLLWSQPLHQLANDEVEYVAVARDLLQGRGWQFYNHYHWLRAPLYPLFLAGSLWLASGDLHRAALPNIVLSVATVYLSYRLALALAGRRAALLAALFSAVLWTFVTFASLYMSETLFSFLFIGSLLCLVSRQADHRPPTTDHRPSTEDEGRTEGQEIRRQGDKEIVFRPSSFVFRLSSSSSFILHPSSFPWRLALGGSLFGLATLTRSISLLFLPIAALWLLIERRTADDQRPTTNDQQTREERGEKLAPRSSLLAPRSWAVLGRWSLVASFVVACALVVLPWTIRNYATYGRVILVETGLSYNLWAFNEPREDEDTIFRTLENISNPAERSDYAMAKGLARLREDPAILLRKLWPNWIYLWRVKPIEDRFILESYYSDVGMPLFGAALLLDDALYLVIALAGIAGLVLYGRTTNDERRTTTDEPSRAQRQPFSNAQNSSLVTRHSAWLFIAWILYVIATVLLTHGEARYRHFLFPALIPFAAWVLTRTGRQGDRETRSEERGARSEERGALLSLLSSLLSRVTLSPCHLVIIVLWALIGGTALVYYPWSWAGQNVAPGWHTLGGDIAWAVGARDAALREYERAIAALETPDAWLHLGDAARALGDQRRALEDYRKAVSLTPSYVAAIARLGDLLRATGDDERAREAFVGRYTDAQRVVDWSWRELRPAPKTRLDVGDGLDFGYVGGVYAAEEQQGATARWTGGKGLLRLRGGTGTLVAWLRLAAPRPGGERVRAQICAAGRCWPIELGPHWRTYRLPFGGTGDQPLLVEVRSETFDAPDSRQLGVLIDAAGVESAGP